MNFDWFTLAMAPPPSEGGQGTGQSPLYLFGWFSFMIAIMYFILIRPQQRKEKERRALLEQIKTGDRVLFSGGIMGTVSNVKEKSFTIKIADKVKIDVSRSAVTQVLQKGEDPEDGQK